MTRILATICVERESQKGIVVGKGGVKIKDIGIEARKQLEEFLQEKVLHTVQTFFKEYSCLITFIFLTFIFLLCLGSPETKRKG